MTKTKYGHTYASAKLTPKSEPVPGREAEQHLNLGGGYVFTIDDWKRLDRFLILGTEYDTYYTRSKDLSRENAQVIERCLSSHWQRTIDRIVEISESGRAPKNDPAIFALAIAASWGCGKVGPAQYGTDGVRNYALGMFSRVCRTGTDKMYFAAVITSNELRGWGPGLRHAYSKAFSEMHVDKLARQFAKYQNRNGWTNADILRMAHPVTGDLLRDSVFGWATGRVHYEDERFIKYAWLPEKKMMVPKTIVHMPAVIEGMEKAKLAKTEQEIVKLIEDYKLEREMLPTKWLTSSKVWAALLPNLGITAIMRNLGNMSKSGLLVAENFDIINYVCDQFNAERILKERLHPIKLLVALKTYSSGKGSKGHGEWRVASRVVDALDEAFYLAFGNVTPTGKKIRICVDTSGSMQSDSFFRFNSAVMGIQGFAPFEAVAAMAMVTARSEKNYQVVAFDTKLYEMNVSPKMRLSDVMKEFERVGGGGTNCGVPIQEALKGKHHFDAFQVWTDMEDWAGFPQSFQLLKQYRAEVQPNAKLIGCGVVATHSSIGDQRDPGTLDVVGFDSAAPEIMSRFISGEF